MFAFHGFASCYVLLRNRQNHDLAYGSVIMKRILDYGSSILIGSTFGVRFC
jgi:hypothetical protein